MLAPFANTVRYKAPGHWFYRRLRRCVSASCMNGSGVWECKFEGGWKAYLPVVGTTVHFGKKVDVK